MELTDDENIKKCAKHCGRCNRNTLQPHEYEWTCVSCNYNAIKRKHELSKKQPRNFINRLKYSQFKIFCICVDIYKFKKVMFMINYLKVNPH